MSFVLKSMYQPKFKLANYSISWEKVSDYIENDRQICRFKIQCPENFGYTIGNSLKRIIMFSSEGCGVVAFTINGLEHIFQSISGIKETVEEIILNLKKINFRIIEDDIYSVEVGINKNKKGPVFASDIVSSELIEILNPDSVICNIDKNFHLNMKIIIGKDTGYIISENHQFMPELKKPYFAIDTLFSNVSCAYDVFTNSEGINKYDSIVLDINTVRSLDESVCMPEKTLLHAVKLMQNCLSFFNPTFESDKVEEVYDNESEYNSIFDIKIIDTELSSRAKNRLLLHNINTIGNLVEKTEHDIQCLGGLGEITINEIVTFLNKYNLSLSLQEQQNYFKKG